MTQIQENKMKNEKYEFKWLPSVYVVAFICFLTLISFFTVVLIKWDFYSTLGQRLFL